MKIALITDTHWGERNDSPTFLDYQKLFLDDVFFPAIEKEGIKNIIHLGDLVDRRKYINLHTATRLWEDFLKPCNEKYNMYVIAGNHDIYHKNTSTTNALRILLRDTNIPHFTDPGYVTLPGHNEPLLFLPWINQDNEAATAHVIQEGRSKLIFGHLEMKGFPMLKGQIAEHGLDHTTFKNYEKVFSGHYHTISSKDNVHYLGSPFQANWGDYGEQRGFHIFDLDTRELTFIPNPYNLFNKFFYNDEGKDMAALQAELDEHYFEQVYVKIIVEKKTDPYLLDWCREYIEKKNPEDLVVVEAMETFSRTYAPIKNVEDTVSILKSCVEELQIDSKQPLENLLIDLYNEAHSNQS